MNLQRREEISALLAEPVTGEAGQALEYRDALMECRTRIDTLEQAAAERVIRGGSRGPTPDYTGEGSALVPPAEAWAVVVPEQGSIYAALLANRDRLRSELDAIAKERSGPHCLRCRNAAVCSTRDNDRSVPLCVADPECSMPLWEP
ncbi:MAG: hypothetical protein ABFE01_07590, partial [Phycisphaerales bacterium]